MLVSTSKNMAPWVMVRPFLSVILIFLYSQICTGFGRSAPTYVRYPSGVNFTMAIQTGSLNFTSLSGIQRDYAGYGTDFNFSFPIYEIERRRLSTIFSSGFMSWTKTGLGQGQFDELYTLRLGPGLEYKWGPLVLQAIYRGVQISNYSYNGVDTKSTRVFAAGASFNGGLNFRFANLGIGLQYSVFDCTVSASKLDFAAGTPDSKYSESTMGLTLIYYFGMPAKRFFNTLFNHPFS